MKNISIIGSGLSGSLLTINLIKNWKEKERLNINLIERDPQKFNTGVAYSTEEFTHLLNVRCSNMSIFPDDPDHFYNWLKKFGYTYTKNDFVPRTIFGQYIKYNFKHTIVDKSESINFNTIFDEVVDISNENSKYKLQFKTGEEITSDIVVLALGQISVAEIDLLKFSNIDNYYRTPWTDEIFAKLKSEDNILFIGSGLTTHDIILSLKERNHQGKLHAISRNGYHPIVHKLYDPYPSFYGEVKDKDINQIFNIVRKHLKNHNEPRAVIDSLRPYVSDIWKSLSKTDKSRFLRHLNPIWNSIRHRMPESTFDSLNELENSGQLRFLKGQILNVEKDSKIKVKFFNKETKNIEELIVDLVINCIGPESNYKRLNLPLIKNLLDSGIIECDEQSITIKTNNWNVINKSGQEINNLMAIGPVLKGELFECTAVPEIRKHTFELSKQIVKCLKLVTT